MKVYKRNRDCPGNLPGKEPVDSSPSLKNSLTETSVAMLMDTVDVSTILVDTPNLPVDLPVLDSNLMVDPSVTIPVDTPSLPINPSMDHRRLLPLFRVNHPDKPMFCYLLSVMCYFHCGFILSVDRMF